MEILNQLKEKIRQYIDVKIKLLKLNVIEQSANILSNFVLVLICLFVVFCILMFFGFTLDEVFADWGMDRALAYLTTMGVYILVFAIVIGFRRGITGYFAGVFIRSISADQEKGGSQG